MQGVYFVSDGTFTKIGVSKDVRRRISSLQTASARPLEVVLVLPGGEDLEKRLHARFAAKRRHGEWFSLTEQDIAQVRTAATTTNSTDAKDRSEYVYSELDEDCVKAIEEQLPNEVLLFDFDVVSVEPVYDIFGEERLEAETEAGVIRTLYALSESESVQEMYEVLLQAVLLDLQYGNPRTSYLTPPLELLVQRRGERVLARNTDMDVRLGWAGSLVRGNRCRQYLPLVRVYELLANAAQGVASPSFCLFAMKKSYDALKGRRICINLEHG